MRSNKLVTVVVPVYNVEKYLDECVESIVSQTYANFEIILVDDGSTDLSGEICDKWKAKDDRIKTIHKQNGGLSSARNAGLEAAKGDYISFIDSDDYITVDYLEVLVNALEKENADFTFCDIDSPRLGDAEHRVTEPIVMSAGQCRDYLINPLSREYVLMVIACNKLFRRSLFEEHSFVLGRLHEDEFMTNNIIYDINKAVFCPYKNYIYRVNEQGITGNKNIYNVRHLDVIDAYEDRIKKALDHSDNGYASNTLKWAFLKMASFYKNGDSAMKEQVRVKFAYLYEGYKKLLSGKQKAKYLLFKVNPEVYFTFFSGN